jgi:hypothetical protein
LITGIKIAEINFSVLFSKITLNYN